MQREYASARFSALLFRYPSPSKARVCSWRPDIGCALPCAAFQTQRRRNKARSVKRPATRQVYTV
eukprot:1587766-Pleurochrysis_carterae.AAC.1